MFAWNGDLNGIPEPPSRKEEKVDRFDTVEIRAARTMDEYDFFYKYRLKKIPPARIEIGVVGFLPKMRRFMDAILLRGGLR